MRLLRLAFLLLFCLQGVAFAQTRAGITTESIEQNWSQLTEQQKASLAATIAQQASGNTVTVAGKVLPSNLNPESVEPWLLLIDRVGQGLVRLAKELGVTANELLSTPVGIITVGLVAYHIMGPTLMEIAVGLLWFCLTMPVWLFLVYKWVIPVVDYKEVVLKGSFWRAAGMKVQVPIRRRVTFSEDRDHNPGPEIISTVGLTLILLITLILIA